MSDVIDLLEHKIDNSFAKRANSNSQMVTGAELKARREDLKVLRRQLAQQLKVSVATIERWEASRLTPLLESDMEYALAQVRFDDAEFLKGRNLCFGRTPIRLAREMLDLTQTQMADRYKLGLSTWKKIENHERRAGDDIIRDIEKEIRMMLVGECE